jgi:hypothetical protein
MLKMPIYWENIHNEQHKEARRNYSKQAALQWTEMQGIIDTFLYSCVSATRHKGANKFSETAKKFKHLGTIVHNWN